MRIYKPYMRFQKTNRFLYLKRVMRRARLKRLTAKDKQYLKNPKLQQAVDNVKRLLRKRPNSLFSQKHRLFYKYKINNYKFMLRNRPIFSVVNFINHKFKLRFDLRFKHRMFKWKYPSKYKSRNFFKVKHKLKYLYRVKKILRFTGFLLNKWKRKKKSLFYRRKKRRRKYFVIYKERHLYKK